MSARSCFPAEAVFPGEPGGRSPACSRSSAFWPLPCSRSHWGRADPTGALSRRSTVPEGAVWASRPAVLARRRLRGDSCPFWPGALPPATPKGALGLGIRSRWETWPHRCSAEAAHLSGLGPTRSAVPKCGVLVRRVPLGGGTFLVCDHACHPRPKAIRTLRFRSRRSGWRRSLASILRPRPVGAGT